MDIDSLDSKIKARKRAMKKRIRNLYVHGRSNDAEILFELLTKNGNPEREVYWVHHLLNRDREDVETLTQLMQERDEKKQSKRNTWPNLNRLRSKKAAEEKGLVSQMNGQEKMLLNLKHDQNMQRRALKEFEQNQKTMLALIKKLGRAPQEGNRTGEEGRGRRKPQKKEREEKRRRQEARIRKEGRGKTARTDSRNRSRGRSACP